MKISIIFLALLVFAVGLNAQQDIEDDGNLQIEIATEDATNANPIAQQVDPIEEDDNFQTELENEDSTSNAIPTAQQDDQTASVDGNLQSQLVDLKSIIAKLTTEREEKDATISEQELVKQKQMALIISLQEKEDKESTGIANFQGQLANQTGINANLQSQLANQANVIANIKSQLANQTAIIANLRTQQGNQTAFNVNLLSQLADQKATNANLTAERDQKNAIIASQQLQQNKLNATIVDLQSQLLNQTAIIANLQNGQSSGSWNNATIDFSDFMTKYPNNYFLFDVRRSPTPPVSKTLGYSNMTVVTYDKAIVNVGNCMNITTGIFTAPISGPYWLSWTGPNGEYIPKSGASRLYTNGGYESWRDESVQTRVNMILKKGDKVFLWALFRNDTGYYPKQYEKCTCFYYS